MKTERVENKKSSDLQERKTTAVDQRLSQARQTRGQLTEKKETNEEEEDEEKRNTDNEPIF